LNSFGSFRDEEKGKVKFKIACLINNPDPEKISMDPQHWEQKVGYYEYYPTQKLKAGGRNNRITVCIYVGPS
jgi:hypothetical protein